jgi:purine-binding chemotaxis protein CheW
VGSPGDDQFTVVIILNIGKRVLGMVVDRVSDVTTLLPEQIKAAPDMGHALGEDHVIGLGTLERRMLILIDIEQLMSSPEMGLVERLAA